MARNSISWTWIDAGAVQMRGEWEGVIEPKLCSSPFGYPHVRSHLNPGRGRLRSRAPARLYSRRCAAARRPGLRSEEHTSELQSLMRISYAVFCLKKKNTPHLSDIYNSYLQLRNN